MVKKVAGIIDKGNAMELEFFDELGKVGWQSYSSTWSGSQQGPDPSRKAFLLRYWERVLAVAPAPYQDNTATCQILTVYVQPGSK